jgi:hypothetical protein
MRGQAGNIRRRSRFRRVFSQGRGRSLGVASVAASVAGLIVNDLRKSDGFIRSIAAPAVRRLLAGRAEERQAVDITDKVEIIKSD